MPARAVSVLAVDAVPPPAKVAPAAPPTTAPAVTSTARRARFTGAPSVAGGRARISRPPARSLPRRDLLDGRLDDVLELDARVRVGHVTLGALDHLVEVVPGDLVVTSRLEARPALPCRRHG